jgi:hypothetical protein
MNRTDFDEQVRRVAEQYEREGYAVVFRPRHEQLPTFLAGQEPDIIATRGDEHAVVAISLNHRDAKKKAGLAHLAKLVNSRLGWRFDLVVLERESPVQGVADRAQEPTDDQLQDMISRSRTARDAGLSVVALISAWAALEAAMRRVRDDAELYGRTTPMQVLGTLYSNGFLTREELDRAREAWTLRTQAVHGFVTPPIDSGLIEDVLNLAAKLVGSESQAEQAAVG